jgi:hypothetical protein
VEAREVQAELVSLEPAVCPEDREAQAEVVSLPVRAASESGVGDREARAEVVGLQRLTLEELPGLAAPLARVAWRVPVGMPQPVG